MNGQCWNAEKRSVNLDKLGDERTIRACGHDSAGQAQVAIEPRVPNATTVGLHSDLQISCLCSFGDRSHAQVGTVDVSSYDGHPGTSCPLWRESEG